MSQVLVACVQYQVWYKQVMIKAILLQASLSIVTMLIHCRCVIVLSTLDRLLM